MGRIARVHVEGWRASEVSSECRKSRKCLGSVCGGTSASAGLEVAARGLGAARLPCLLGAGTLRRAGVRHGVGVERPVRHLTALCAIQPADELVGLVVDLRKREVPGESVRSLWRRRVWARPARWRARRVASLEMGKARMQAGDRAARAAALRSLGGVTESTR